MCCMILNYELFKLVVNWLTFYIVRNSDNSQQDKLSDMMWSIWPELPGFGRKAAQFVDLLGYFTLKRSLSEDKASEFSKKAVCLLRKQNEILRNHPNSNVYRYSSFFPKHIFWQDLSYWTLWTRLRILIYQPWLLWSLQIKPVSTFNTNFPFLVKHRLLSGLVDFDGFYLESDPCLVCNNPEVPYSICKLSAVRSDARFSTTCQMVKLVSSHNISRISLRISDVKRQKMVGGMGTMKMIATTITPIPHEYFTSFRTWKTHGIGTFLDMKFSFHIWNGRIFPCKIPNLHAKWIGSKFVFTYETGDSHMKIYFTYEILISHMELKQFREELPFSYVKLHVKFL